MHKAVGSDPKAEEFSFPEELVVTEIQFGRVVQTSLFLCSCVWSTFCPSGTILGTRQIRTDLRSSAERGLSQYSAWVLGGRKRRGKAQAGQSGSESGIGQAGPLGKVGGAS